MKTIMVFENVDVQDTGLEDLFVLQNQLKVIDAGFQELKLETPENIIDKLTEIEIEVNARVRGELQRRLRAAKARRAALRSSDEKRRDLDAEIAALESKVS